MKNSYEEIISIIRGDIDKLEKALVNSVQFPTDSLNNLLLAQAKRIRPALAFLFARANGFDITSELIELQTAVELAHTASLIHDDIIDLSDKRRGLETLNSEFSDKIAVLTGDYILSVALKKLVKLKNFDILQDFLATFSDMANGEINQYFTKYNIPQMDDYILKTTQKTAGLFQIALKSSAKLLKTSDEIWSNFALNFGIAFQIKNDLKNVLEDNSDIKNGIYTAPVIFSGSTDVTSESIIQTKNLINEYLLKAKKTITNIPKNEYSQALIEILEYLKND